MSKELKACPFCGTQPFLMNEPADGGERAWWVECRECGSLHAYFHTEDNAIAAWNRRTPDWRELAQEAATALKSAEKHMTSSNWLIMDAIANAKAAGLEV